MANRLFEGKEQAVAYQKYRVSPSQELIGEILTFLEKKKEKPFDLAVDVGCGSGQGTVLLTPHFNQVVGTDVSPAQLEMAQTNNHTPNVSYRQSAAEELPFPDTSADLVTAMSAAHWFDRPRFLQEAYRLLKPRGCLALLNYTLDMELQYGDDDCSRRLNEVCKEFYAALQPYRNAYLGPSSALLYKEMYDSIPYPEKEWHECFWAKHCVPLCNYVGLVESFTSYQALLAKDPEVARRLSHDITDKLLAVMGVSSKDTEVVMSVKYYYLLACKPALN
ncbi:putative methyltransferase DDB_G0268948 isoform X1 [Megalops cyprinoides]|uniref:putative methyltransferase DDB_G0268948 isoform X1 n=2 Tax=Megalops cyprinoides TaxID=118141 RepID=UPI001863D8BC|nr:putative methyltransferase DDB_G0268948 isoform X1 [Megalops cyprinoides]